MPPLLVNGWQIHFFLSFHICYNMVLGSHSHLRRIAKCCCITRNIKDETNFPFLLWGGWRQSFGKIKPLSCTVFRIQICNKICFVEYYVSKQVEIRLWLFSLFKLWCITIFFLEEAVCLNCIKYAVCLITSKKSTHDRLFKD